MSETHEVTLTTSDDTIERLDVPVGTTVLAAGEDTGMLLPSLCRLGTCGVCRADVTSGTYELGGHDPGVLPVAEREAGGVLLCRTSPTSPLAVRLPYESSRITRGRIPVRGGRVDTVEAVAAGTVRLVVTLDEDPVEGTGVTFDAGQFVELGLPDQTWGRAYSLAGLENWQGRIELFVHLRPGGAFSTYLARAAVGDRLVVTGPRGAFGLVENGLRPRWFVGGGAGFAPLLAMLRRMAEWGEPQPVRAYVGFQHDDEVFCAPALAELATSLPGLRATVCVAEPDPATTRTGTEPGTPAEAVARDLAALGPGEAPDLYLCGPPAMVDAVAAAAGAHGVPASQIYSERIVPA